MPIWRRCRYRCKRPRKNSRSRPCLNNCKRRAAIRNGQDWEIIFRRVRGATSRSGNWAEHWPASALNSDPAIVRTQETSTATTDAGRQEGVLYFSAFNFLTFNLRGFSFGFLADSVCLLFGLFNPELPSRFTHASPRKRRALPLSAYNRTGASGR